LVNITKEQVVEWLGEQSVLEITSLLKDLEAKWGISAAAPVAGTVAIAVTVAADLRAVEEKIDFEIVPKAMGDKKLRSFKSSTKLQDWH
jgi:large subunit ribosomal protein L7/L12